MIRSTIRLLLVSALLTLEISHILAAPATAQKWSFTDLFNSTEFKPLIPPPPERMFLKNANYLSGVPLGGVGCGSVQILPNGEFGNATLNNNWTDPIPTLPGWFACVWTNAGGRIHAARLVRSSNPGMHGVENILYRGDFPRATLQYQDIGLPLQITMHAYSPLIPFDLMNSSLPAFYLMYTIRNNSEGPVDVTLALSLEGLSGLTDENPIISQNCKLDESALKNGTVGFMLTSSNPSNLPSPMDYNRIGNYAILTQTPSPDMKVSIREWDDTGGRPSWWNDFSRTGALSGKADTSIAAKHPAGVMTIHFSMKTGETYRIPFAVAWYTPHLYDSSGKEYGHLYELNFNNSETIARYLLENRYVFDALTDEWRNRLRQSSLPNWFVNKLINNASVLFTNTLLTRDSANGKEDPGPSVFDYYDSLNGKESRISSLNRRVCLQPLLDAMFPTLDRAQLLQFLAVPTADGSLPMHDGFDFNSPSLQPANVSSAAYPVDATLNGILQITRYYMWTKDDAFLQAAYPHVKRAVDLLSLLAANNGNIPSGGTLFGQSHGIAAGGYLAVEWLAALKSCQTIAMMRGDVTFAKLCDTLRQAAQHVVTERLWNGSNLSGVSSSNTPYNAPNLLQGELAGQALLQPFSDARLLPDGMLQTTLSNMVAQNKTSQRGTPSAENATYPGLSELFQGSLYAYRNESNNCITLLQYIHQWEMNDLHSPWAIPEKMGERNPSPTKGNIPPACSIDTAASWSCLYALEGFSLDLPDGRLGFLPHLPDGWESLSAPIFAPSFWGWMHYLREKGDIRIAFRLDRLIPIGKRGSSARVGSPVSTSGAGFQCREILLPRLPNGKDEVTAVLQESQVPGSIIQKTEQTLLYRFDQPVEIGVGRKLEVVVE